MVNSALQDMNLRANRPYARQWVQQAQLQMFSIAKDGQRHSLKAFLNGDEKMLWLEFRTTAPKPNYSMPFSLYDDPVNFRNALDAEWASLQRIAKRSIDGVANA